MQFSHFHQIVEVTVEWYPYSLGLSPAILASLATGRCDLMASAIL